MAIARQSRGKCARCGFFVGIYQDSDGHTLLITRCSIVADNEKFQLTLNGLTSAVVIH
jgi:hypothetical protein